MSEHGAEAMIRGATSQVLYVGYYDHVLNVDENRTSWLSATSKMDYISEALTALGHRVLILSPSRTANNRYYSAKRTDIGANIALQLLPTLPWGNRIQRGLSIIASQVFLFAFLVVRATRRHNVVVYHALGLMRAVQWARRIRRFHLILEVEELYQDVTDLKPRLASREIRFLSSADAYMFSTSLLQARVKAAAKPYVVVHGAYRMAPSRRSRFGDGRIHVVYAGRIDQDKGAYAAVEASEFLDEAYHVHVLGFGTSADLYCLEDKLRSIRDKTTASVSYEGVLHGTELSAFLQRCDIGLATQRADATFNETSFPSKILTYITNELAVVSVRIPALEGSALSDLISFYDGNDARVIASAIRHVSPPHGHVARDAIERLHLQFLQDLARILLADGGLQ